MEIIHHAERIYKELQLVNVQIMQVYWVSMQIPNFTKFFINTTDFTALFVFWESYWRLVIIVAKFSQNFEIVVLWMYR